MIHTPEIGVKLHSRSDVDSSDDDRSESHNDEASFVVHTMCPLENRLTQFRLKVRASAEQGVAAKHAA